MSPAPHPARELRHRRSVDVQAFARPDGLWEVEAQVQDVKTRPMNLATGRLEAGQPLHDMGLWLLVDTQFNILDAQAQTRSAPYGVHCQGYGQAYRQLVGLNLMRGFRAQLKQRLGGVAGCTHLTELAQVLPTALLQSFAGDVLDPRENSEHGEQPFQLDRCHALAVDAPAVKAYYPRWHRPRVPAEAEASALTPSP